MQFHLETVELKLLADTLLEEDPQQHNEILKKVLSRDLGFDADELLQTGELLAAKKRTMKEEIARQTDVTQKAQLEQRLALLDRVLERVNEACVMF